MRRQLTKRENDLYRNKTVKDHSHCCPIPPSLFLSAQDLYDWLFDKHSPEMAERWYRREFKVMS